MPRSSNSSAASPLSCASSNSLSTRPSARSKAAMPGRHGQGQQQEGEGGDRKALRASEASGGGAQAASRTAFNHEAAEGGDAAQQKLKDAEKAMADASSALDQSDLGEAGEQARPGARSMRQGTCSMAEDMACGRARATVQPDQPRSDGAQATGRLAAQERRQRESPRRDHGGAGTPHPRRASQTAWRAR